MAKKITGSFSNSLKGIIWLSTVALAFFVCTFGSLSYIVVSFLVNDPFYAIFIPFLLLAIIIVAFGLWLSSEVVNPVENVLLLAKSFERGVSTSLPKTSGSRETDELLETIHRISGQVQRLVNSMDNVAQGNLEAVYAQNLNSDRISVSFQKLLAKVSESIHAKQELEKLQNAVRQLSEESALIRDNRLNAASAAHNSTQEIAFTINHLIEHLSELAAKIKNSAGDSQTAASEIQKNLRNAVEQGESRNHEINQAAATLKKVPQLVQKISEEISQSALSTDQALEKVRQGTKNAQANFDAVNHLRKQVQEAVRRIQKLNECSQGIKTAAQTVGDLAQRTNLVSMNASIQATELGEQGKKFLVVSEEIERLAARADKTNKHINALNKAIQSEIEKVENALEMIVGEAANFSKFTIETGNLNGDLERHLSRYLNLQQKIVAYTQEQTDGTEHSFQILNLSTATSPTFARELKESIPQIDKIAHLMESLQAAANHFDILPSVELKLSRPEINEPSKKALDKLEGETVL